jgi:hypothetical protein
MIKNDMKPKDLLDKLKSTFNVDTDAAVGNLVDLTGGRLSQWRSSKGNLTTRQVASLIKRTVSLAEKRAVRNAIRPIVELYPIERTSSRQEANWEILPSNKVKHPKQHELRKYLEGTKGIYFFYDSGGKVLYTGKTEKQTLWKEMNLAYNREREAHKVYQVDHPKNRTAFTPAWKKIRQPRSQIVCLHDSAKFFSVYEVSPELIANLEAMIIRAFCNDVSNVKTLPSHRIFRKIDKEAGYETCLRSP